MRTGFKKGNIPWNKNKKRVQVAWNKDKKMIDYPQCGFQKENKINLGKVNEKSKNWKGDDAKYVAMHAWIYKQKGKAKNYKCVDCGKQAIDWSNKNHSYRRVLEDYFPRCRSCHKIYDKKFE